MRNALYTLSLWLVTMAPVSVAAQNDSGLPDEAAVETALDEHPSVMAARARVEAARADARALKAGPHEVTLSGSYVRRDVDNEGRFNEYDATVMRPFRLPGKKRLDKQAGEYGLVAAENRAEDVKHQAATLLADLWWGWLGNAEEARVDAQAVMNYEAMLASVQRRMQLRDAAQLDVDQAEAALGAARLAAEQSKGKTELSRVRLAAQYPSLPLPIEAPELPLPTVPAGGFAALRDLVIARSHEIAAADAEAARVKTLADRTRRDRIADPSLGFRIFSERDGLEKGVGLIASIPLGGTHRSALAERAEREAQAVSAEAGAVRFDVQEMADTGLASANAAWRSWKRSREGMKAQVDGVIKMRRGHDLGAFDLSDVLLVERMTHDAFRSEVQARKDALLAITKLRIDSHTLWIGDDDHETQQ